MDELLGYCPYCGNDVETDFCYRCGIEVTSKKEKSMKEIKAPNKYKTDEGPLIFLCGSIEMGAAENWQEKFAKGVQDLDCTVLNPRRDDWDSSWVQKKENKQFNEQVTWELEAQERADLIVVYFDAKTKSPITLLELGLFAQTGKLIVYCPDGFWRKGNVDIVCDRYNVKQVSSLEEMINHSREFLKNLA